MDNWTDMRKAAKKRAKVIRPPVKTTVRAYRIGQVVRFAIQAGGSACGEVIETSDKNQHWYKVRTADGREFGVMAAEIF